MYNMTLEYACCSQHIKRTLVYSLWSPSHVQRTNSPNGTAKGKSCNSRRSTHHIWEHEPHWWLITLMVKLPTPCKSRIRTQCSVRRLAPGPHISSSNRFQGYSIKNLLSYVSPIMGLLSTRMGHMGETPPAVTTRCKNSSSRFHHRITWVACLKSSINEGQWPKGQIRFLSSHGLRKAGWNSRRKSGTLFTWKLCTIENAKWHSDPETTILLVNQYSTVVVLFQFKYQKMPSRYFKIYL